MALPPEPIAVPGPESHCTVRMFVATGASVFTSTERKRWSSVAIPPSTSSKIAIGSRTTDQKVARSALRKRHARPGTSSSR